MNTCCFTGHREIPENERAALAARLRDTLTALIDRGVTCFSAGGALGFDTLAAQAVLELKQTYPHIRLVLVLPCQDQADRWSAADRAVYNDIVSKADKTVWTAQRYHRGCMHVRNRRLVDEADVCVCYLCHSIGGTAYTVGYARQKGIPVINLADNGQPNFKAGL